MLQSRILKAMIAISDGNLHDINHFLKVYSYAKLIGELEELDDRTQLILECAAIVHDIACPLCRSKYGSTMGKYQETEGMPLTQEFLKDFDMPEDEKERIVYLVGHHHTLKDIDGLDYQILIEADFLVNAEESGYSTEKIRNFKEKIFKTPTGISLLSDIYGV